MKQKIFPVQASILNPQALQTLVSEKYGWRVTNCRVWSLGLNDVYQIQAEQTYYLRISHVNRGFSRRDYEEELQAIEALRQNGVRTCIPLKTADQELLWEVNAPEGVRYAVVFEEVKNDSPVNFYETGKLAAQIHQNSDKLQLPASRMPLAYEQLIEIPLRRIHETPEILPDETAYYKKTSDEMWKSITDSLPLKSPYYGLCHGDLHYGNIYFSAGKPQVFDFDCMGYGYRAYDLSVLLWDETMGDRNFGDSGQWKEFIRGYQSIRPLSAAEQHSIFAFAALRQLWFVGLMIHTASINNGWEELNRRFFQEQFRQYQFWYEKWQEKK